jgi:hypothetical protein
MKINEDKIDDAVLALLMVVDVTGQTRTPELVR